jgi:NAD(P)-dependent dehydrogenase (short-subunit alcohol dehydrogenase family)
MSATWLITGATSGFGRLVAERALADGTHVIAVGRRADRLPTGPHVTPITLDVTAPEAEDTLRAAVEAAGRLDVLVNNAGYGMFGAVEQTSLAEARAVLETNVLANLAVLRAALPALRAGKGRIVQLSSFMGQLAVAASGLYSASKAAVEMLSEALAQELAPAGVQVTIVEAGQYATGFVTSAHVIMPDDVYAPTVGKFLSDVSAMPHSAFGDPAEVADAIVSLVKMPEPPLRLALGNDAIAAIRVSLDSRLAELNKSAPLAH